MTNRFCRISLISGRTLAKSLDIIRGAASTAQMAICNLL